MLMILSDKKVREDAANQRILPNRYTLIISIIVLRIPQQLVCGS